ncbi:MAG TPA: dTMP kinase [Bacteroidota bacterium]|nr:dTMP kinase [Bacteroidota bacterium]
MFITFEGIDYSGKSTQAKLLVDVLRQQRYETVLLREPGGTPVSEKVRELVLDKKHLELTQRTELLLFSAARSQLVSEIIRPALDAGTIVVCDRFYDSTTAYQGYGRGIDLADVASLNTIATAGLVPDLSIFVDVTVDEIIRRQHVANVPVDRMESAGREFFERVRAGYHAIAKAEPLRWHIVDGIRSVDVIHKEIVSVVQSRLSHSGV